MIQGYSAIKCVLAVESFYFGFFELNDGIFGGVMCAYLASAGLN